MKTSSNNKYSTVAIILAFGKTPRDLNVPGEQGLKGKGVSYCAVCDGPLFKQKRLADIGIEDPALDSGLFLKGMASKVYLVQQSHYMYIACTQLVRMILLGSYKMKRIFRSFLIQ